MTKTKARSNQIQATSITMLVLGLLTLAASFLYDSSIAAFIGLGLTFWGALLLYIRPEGPDRETILKSAISPSFTTINQILEELGYNGDATYLPPKYFANPETTKICVTKQKYGNTPTPKQILQNENKPVARTSDFIVLAPSGTQLSKLLEEAMGKSFLQTDIQTLQQKLPKIFIEDLEIAENLEIETQSNFAMEKHNPSPTSATKNKTIRAKITKPAIELAFQEAQQEKSSISSPVISAIAIALTKATGKPVRVASSRTSEDGDIVEATYTVIEE
jgi:hypothetical protein